jgi:hypothetical protein
MVKVIRKRLVNPARSRRRNLSPKQIKFFGTPAQKAALKRKRSKSAHAAPRRKASTRIAKPAHRRRPARTNPGDIFTIGLAGLANPARRKRSNMAKRKTNKASRPRRRNKATTHRRRANPVFHSKAHRPRRRRHNPAVARRRRNPESVGSIGNVLVQAAWAGGGAVGSRVLTQLALGGNNNGVLGYLANAGVALGLGWGVKKFTKDANAAKMVVVGGFIGILLRAVQDFTPFGSAVTSAFSGLGDVGIYGATTFFAPLQEAPGATRGIPLLPGAMSQPAPAPAGASGTGPRRMANAGVGGRFSGGGRFS